MRKIKKYIFVLLLIPAFLLILCCGCSTNSKESNRTIADIYGRNVQIPNQVDKIATVGSAARICVYAGATDKLVAVTEMEKPDKLRPYTIAQEEKFKNLPSTSNGNHISSTNIDKEKLISLNPDVIISSRSAEECNKLQEDVKIPVIGVTYQDEIFTDNVYKCIEIIGEIANTTNYAYNTINFIKQCDNEISSKIQNDNFDKKIYRGAVNNKGEKGLTGTISNYCIYENLKINNVANKKNLNNCYDTNIEQILTWNPDYIFADCTNKEKVEFDINTNKDTLNKISALQNHNLYYVAPFNFNGTNIEYGLCEIYFTAKTLFPDKFENINLDDKFDEIFKILDGKEILKILKDKGIYFGKAN